MARIRLRDGLFATGMRTNRCYLDSLPNDLRAQYPQVLPVPEMSYDALISSIPLCQLQRLSESRPGFRNYARAFPHLRCPAPGRGRSGVHESGFRSFHPKVRKDSVTIPTLTVVDDTLAKYREVMAQVITGAKLHAGIR